MSTWHYYENGEKITVTGGQLKGLAKTGRITPETIVETEDGKKAPARKVKGLTFVTATQPETVASETATPETEIYGLSQANPPVVENTSTAVTPEEVNPFDTIALHTDESAIVFPVPEEVNPFAAPPVETNPFTAASPPFTQQSQTAPTPQPVNVFCTNCGNSVTEQTIACMSCGARPTGHKKFCRSCGVGMNPEQVMCIKCGAAISTGYQDAMKKVADALIPAKRIAQSVISPQSIEKIKRLPKPVVIGGVAVIIILCLAPLFWGNFANSPITVVKGFYAVIQSINPDTDENTYERLVAPYVTAEFFRNEPDDLSLRDEIRNVGVSSHSRVINGNNATVTVLHRSGREVRVRLVRLDGRWRIASIH